jgi:hypothetical protein
MPMSVACPTCGHNYSISRKLAGKTLRCKKCEGPIKVPQPAAVEEPPSVAQMPTGMSMRPASTGLQSAEYAAAGPAGAAYAPPARPPALPPSQTMSYRSGPVEVSKDRLLAGRICYVLSALGFLGGSCVGILGVFAASMGRQFLAGAPPGLAAFVGVILGIVGALLFGVATIYLVCGINIRKGGHASAIVALIVACLHTLLVLLGLFSTLMGIARLGADSGSAVQAVVQVVYAAALGQLIFYLARVLQEPRV